MSEYNCVPCCDFCVSYKDNGGGSEKRGGFAGIGKCLLTNKDTDAFGDCDKFKCSICKRTEA